MAVYASLRRDIGVVARNAVCEPFACMLQRTLPQRGNYEQKFIHLKQEAMVRLRPAMIRSARRGCASGRAAGRHVYTSCLRVLRGPTRRNAAISTDNWDMRAPPVAPARICQLSASFAGSGARRPRDFHGQPGYACTPPRTAAPPARICQLSASSAGSGAARRRDSRGQLGYACAARRCRTYMPVVREFRGVGDDPMPRFQWTTGICVRGQARVHVYASCPRVPRGPGRRDAAIPVDNRDMCAGPGAGARICQLSASFAGSGAARRRDSRGQPGYACAPPRTAAISARICLLSKHLAEPKKVLGPGALGIGALRNNFRTRLLQNYD